MTEPLLLILSWLGFFVLHSWFASHGFKAWFRRRFPRLWPRYRLLYNGVSAALVAVPLGIALLWPSPLLWRWTGPGWWLANGLAALAVLGFLYSTRYYDGLTFLGLRRDHAGHIGSADEPFVISPLHRWVRHPWYFFGLVLIWTRDMHLYWLLTCLLATAYFVVGSRLEERKFIAEYGARYARYRQRVAGLVPLPWKHLSRAEAAALLREGD